jgi:hypothetical protein
MTIRTVAICFYGAGLVAISTLVQNQGAASHKQIRAVKASLARNQVALRPAGKTLYTGDPMAAPSPSAVPQLAPVRKTTGDKRAPALPACRKVPRRAEARWQIASSTPRRASGAWSVRRMMKKSTTALSVWAKRLRHVVPRREVA